MKIIRGIGVAVMGGLLLGSTLLAQSDVDHRERRQQKRIRQGARSGELTAKEVRKLEKEQAKIHVMEAKANSDGKLTAKENAKIHRKQSQASRHIYKEKHDRQARN